MPPKHILPSGHPSIKSAKFEFVLTNGAETWLCGGVIVEHYAGEEVALIMKQGPRRGIYKFVSIAFGSFSGTCLNVKAFFSI